LVPPVPLAAERSKNVAVGTEIVVRQGHWN